MVTQFLTCSEAGALLGLSASTVKRLCDDGHLDAIRTPGGHRRISKQAVAGWQSRKEPKESREASGSDNASLAVGELVHLLLHDSGRAFSYLDRQAEQLGVIDLVDDVICPVMIEVGRRWEDESMSIYQEHQISNRISSYLIQLSERIPVNRDSENRAVGSAPEHELSDIATKSIELCFRESGWNAVSYGANLPARELAAAAIELQASVVWISYTHPQQEAEICRANRILRDSLPSPVRLIIGGGALSNQLRKQMFFDFAGDSMAHLCNYISRLR